MDFKYYLNTFQQASAQRDIKALSKKEIDTSVGIVLNSVYLKLYKKAWTTPSQDPLHATSRIFFSVWVNETAIEKNKLFYNIHALKLRQLEGFSIQSRKFAEAFRHDFKKFEKDWKNVSTAFGPLTLMEGWIELDPRTLQKDIVQLTGGFLTIEHLIDRNLDKFKR
jgi:hypothetical protein